MTFLLRIEITKADICKGNLEKTIDYVAQEISFHVLVNRIHYVTIFCSPTDLKELAIGNLFTSGIIESVDGIRSVESDDDKRICHVRLNEDIDVRTRLRLARSFSRVLFSVCGTGASYEPSRNLRKIESRLKFHANVVLRCVNQLNRLAVTFRKTGGVHAAAINERDGRLLAFAEDVGRHNAVDKVIGTVFLAKGDFGNSFLTLTGRLTSDIVLKAVRAGIPVVASLAAALDSGVALAEDVNLTLVGFARGNRLNIYTAPERILL